MKARSVSRELQFFLNKNSLLWEQEKFWFHCLHRWIPQESGIFDEICLWI